MHLALTPEVEAFRDELRAYFAELMTPERLHGLAYSDASGETYRDAARQMGRDGKLGIGWPVEYGGQGRSPLEQFIWFDEAERAYAPTLLVTLNTVGPTLMRFGTEEQKNFFLPNILKGELHVAVGYTEPEAGTDLASLRTKAIRDGDEYVINGNKIFTTGASDAEYVWLACRTDPEAPKHKGISLFLVDTSLPGFKVTPMDIISGQRTTSTYYDDLRVPASAMVGNENEGWKIITQQLNHERVALSAPGRIERMLYETLDWAKKTGAFDEPWVRLNLARVKAKTETQRLMNYRLASDMSAGTLKAADASALKVYGTELAVEAFKLLLEIVGAKGTLKDDSPGIPLHGRLDRAWRRAVVTTFGGGVNEVQREIIATTGLGLPRSR
jgi:alkylation response protein AidB-like acyl-CoA dehydrogenase